MYSGFLVCASPTTDFMLIPLKFAVNLYALCKSCQPYWGGGGGGAGGSKPQVIQDVQMIQRCFVIRLYHFLHEQYINVISTDAL